MVPCQRRSRWKSARAVNAILTVIDKIKSADDKSKYTGIYHFSNEGVCSWYDFTQAIHQLEGIDSCHVTPIHTEDYPVPATRPHFSVLDKSKIKSTFGIEIRWWKDALKECIKEL